MGGGGLSLTGSVEMQLLGFSYLKKTKNFMLINLQQGKTDGGGRSCKISRKLVIVM